MKNPEMKKGAPEKILGIDDNVDGNLDKAAVKADLDKVMKEVKASKEKAVEGGAQNEQSA